MKGFILSHKDADFSIPDGTELWDSYVPGENIFFAVDSSGRRIIGVRIRYYKGQPYVEYLVRTAEELPKRYFLGSRSKVFLAPLVRRIPQ